MPHLVHLHQFEFETYQNVIINLYLFDWQNKILFSNVTEKRHQNDMVRLALSSTNRLKNKYKTETEKVKINIFFYSVIS